MTGRGAPQHCETDPGPGGAEPREAAPPRGPARFSLLRLAVLYGLFGAVATGANLSAQAMVHMAWPLGAGSLDTPYFLALCCGTGVGLVVKFALDKIWIFQDFDASGAREHGGQFLLYSAMGVVTTFIFWGMQSAAFALWGSEEALFLGAATGLAIGYVVKYQLDKRFVFNSRPAAG